jgi:uncharacterized protein YbaA (DUF1428 family)
MLWVCLLCRSTGDAVSHLASALATLFVCKLPFDGKRLIYGGFETLVDLK